jgi:hypothetical protein
MQTIGISGNTLMWIHHFLFTISRTQPKINLQRLILRNRFGEKKGVTVGARMVSFKRDELCGSVFIKYPIEEGVAKLCVSHLIICLFYFRREVLCGKTDAERDDPFYGMKQ